MATVYPDAQGMIRIFMLRRWPSRYKQKAGTTNERRRPGLSPHTCYPAPQAVGVNRFGTTQYLDGNAAEIFFVNR